MRHTRFLPTFVFLGVLAALPLRGQSDELEQLGQRERQLIQEWRKSAKEFENLKAGIKELPTDKEIQDRLAADNVRSEPGRAEAQAATEIQEPCELVERWRKRGGEAPQLTFKDMLTEKQFQEQHAADMARVESAAADRKGHQEVQQPCEFDLIKIKAEANDPVAQLRLGWMYDNGEGVKREPGEALKWWLRAAEQGVAVAQYNVGVIYAAGQGVAPDYAKALTWFRKAVDQRWPDAYAALGWMYRSGKGVKQDKTEAYLLWREGAELGSFKAKQALNSGGPRVILESTPGRVLFLAEDGVCCGQEIVNLQQHTTNVSQLNQAEEGRRRREGSPVFEGTSVVTEEGTQESENVKIVSRIISDYHSAHTYVGKQTGASADIFVCGDMAKDVWDMVLTKGINAKIQIGNIERRIKSMLDANHAWVMAEVSPGKWLALETTGGYVVHLSKNDKYYYGHSFANPKDFNEYEKLGREYIAALSKERNAVENYNEMRDQYNGANGLTQNQLRYELDRREAIATERIADLKEVTGKLKTLLSEND